MGKKTNGLGIASLIFSIIALVTSCFVIGVVPATIGLIIGIIGLTQKEMKKGTAIAGVVCSAIALVISIGMISYMITSDPVPVDTEVAEPTVETQIAEPEPSQVAEVETETEIETETETETQEPVETEEEYKASCQEYSYKDVLRNPDDYIGKRIKVTVKISTVKSAKLFSDKYYFAWSDNGSGYYYENEYGIFEKRDEENPKLLEDDVITVYGEIAEPRETESYIVNSEELFCIDMKYVDLIAE